MELRHRPDITVTFKSAVSKYVPAMLVSLPQVQLVGHSAGGWLARAFLADPDYFDASEAATASYNRAVRSLVSLGTPHVAPPADKVRDMTGGALTWVDTTWPGAPQPDTAAPTP
jgi:triacylglycerol esterase/lipase EstA (alpha/beta hydrolase family)